MAEVLRPPAREAQRLLREIPVVAPCIHFDFRLPLDPGLDFVVHDNGMINLTEAGFRRMVQAHSAGIDTVLARKLQGRRQWVVTYGCRGDG